MDHVGAVCFGTAKGAFSSTVVRGVSLAAGPGLTSSSGTVSSPVGTSSTVDGASACWVSHPDGTSSTAAGTVSTVDGLSLEEVSSSETGVSFFATGRSSTACSSTVGKGSSTLACMASCGNGGTGEEGERAMLGQVGDMGRSAVVRGVDAAGATPVAPFAGNTEEAWEYADVSDFGDVAVSGFGARVRTGA